MKLPTHRKTKVRTSLRFLLPFLFLVQTLFAQQTPPVLVYSDSTTRIETSPYAAVLEDAKAEWTIEQVRTMPDSYFHQTKSAILHLGDCSSRFWVRFAIKNETKEDLFFQNTFSLIHYLDMYVVSEDGQGMVFSNRIGAKDAIYGFIRLDERIFFFCFGLYLILAVYNLAIYFNSRDTPFLCYALYQLGVILYYLHYTGPAIGFVRGEEVVFFLF